MMLRRSILLVGILMLLLPAAAAMAGGWVVITLDTVPDQIRAGEPVALSFMVRQHGRTPIHSVSPVVTATNAESGELIRVDAEPALEIGRYEATVNFPSDGIWEWSISAEPFPQTATFAPLTVLATQGSVVTEATGQPTAGIQSVLRWSGLALLVVALFLVLLDRRRGQEVAAPLSGD